MEHDTLTSTPRVYVACLASYNNGILYGRWIDADQSEAALRSAVSTMLRASPIPEAEEYAIHDYEGFGDVRLEEYASLGRVGAMAALAVEHGDPGLAVLAHFSGDLDESRQALEERYLGRYPSLADHMQQTMEDALTIPDSIRYYVDWEAMAHDAEISGELFTVRTGWNEIHVFYGF